MNKTQLNLFTGEPTSVAKYEYSFLLSPPAPIKEMIKARKKRLNEEIGLSADNLHSIAHISLRKINLADESLRFTRLRQNLSSYTKFQIEINAIGEENWKKTHHFGAKIWFWGGIVLVILIAVSPQEYASWYLTAALVPMVIVPFVYSFLIFRRKQSSK